MLDMFAGPVMLEYRLVLPVGDYGYHDSIFYQFRVNVLISS